RLALVPFRRVIGNETEIHGSSVRRRTEGISAHQNPSIISGGGTRRDSADFRNFGKVPRLDYPLHLSVPLRKRQHQSQFHRSQIGRAQRYIRRHVSESITLTQIAREAGSSEYHFARLFLAYTTETPFDFLRRIRLITALRMLQEDPEGSITEIALDV